MKTMSKQSFSTTLRHESRSRIRTNETTTDWSNSITIPKIQIDSSSSQTLYNILSISRHLVNSWEILTYPVMRIHNLFS
ncbi:unnamed protein product [Schistosoma rodhaini]|uniref:Uncharacterized protein n=1 Tax=Schistosoma rodhaini TaxID=6188 RepID=A0AA85GKF4_9TREM|nr:unnamed protein product [Schistosoma rodhaini]